MPRRLGFRVNVRKFVLQIEPVERCRRPFERKLLDNPLPRLPPEQMKRLFIACQSVANGIRQSCRIVRWRNAADRPHDLRAVADRSGHGDQAACHAFNEDVGNPSPNAELNTTISLAA